MTHKTSYSTHHNIPAKYKEDFVNPDDVNDKRNKTVVKDKWHVHHHAINGADTPVMQLMGDTEFNLKVLKQEFVKDLIEVFEKHIGHYYIFETRIQEELWKLFELEDAFTKQHRNDKSI